MSLFSGVMLIVIVALIGPERACGQDGSNPDNPHFIVGSGVSLYGKNFTDLSSNGRIEFKGRGRLSLSCGLVADLPWTKNVVFFSALEFRQSNKILDGGILGFGVRFQQNQNPILIFGPSVGYKNGDDGTGQVIDRFVAGFHFGVAFSF